MRPVCILAYCSCGKRSEPGLKVTVLPCSSVQPVDVLVMGEEEEGHPYPGEGEVVVVVVVGEAWSCEVEYAVWVWFSL